MEPKTIYLWLRLQDSCINQYISLQLMYTTHTCCPPGVSAQPGCMDEKWISLCWAAHSSVMVTCVLWERSQLTMNNSRFFTKSIKKHKLQKIEMLIFFFLIIRLHECQNVYHNDNYNGQCNKGSVVMLLESVPLYRANILTVNDEGLDWKATKSITATFLYAL